MNDLTNRLEIAIRHYWDVRRKQAKLQGRQKGVRDKGARSAVTGGAHCDGLVNLVTEILKEAGLPDATILRNQNVSLPGYFRPTKKWDLIVVADSKLLAAIEFKSQVGPSFGNNVNNRAEEALGNAVDILTAYEEGAFKPSERPWLGYFFLLEDCPASNKPVEVEEPHFKVFPEFVNASYGKRYELLCLRLVRKRLYDAACFIMSTADSNGAYRESDAEISFRTFVASLVGRASAFVALHK